MRILISLLSLFVLLACDSKQSTKTTTPPPTVNERVGIYKNATIYTGRSDYEFEIGGKAMLIRVSNFDTLNQPNIPSNLTTAYGDGLPGPNPLLIGKKFTLAFAPQEQLKSIKLLGAHDPSNAELPAIPENYSGLLSVAPSADSRAYLNLFSDLTAILLVNYEPNEPPMYKYGRWTRTDNGQKVNVQLDDENWEFLVRENALVLISNQMGTGRLSLIATEEYDICQYIQHTLSNLSTTDNQPRIDANYITNESPLADILRTEQAYLELYKTLENVYQIEESLISQVLRANPTAQGVCDLVLRDLGEGH